MTNLRKKMKRRLLADRLLHLSAQTFYVLFLLIISGPICFAQFSRERYNEMNALRLDSAPTRRPVVPAYASPPRSSPSVQAPSVDNRAINAATNASNETATASKELAKASKEMAKLSKDMTELMVQVTNYFLAQQNNKQGAPKVPPQMMFRVPQPGRTQQAGDNLTDLKNTLDKLTKQFAVLSKKVDKLSKAVYGCR
jgi:hypothetical protein